MAAFCLAVAVGVVIVTGMVATTASSYLRLPVLDDYRAGFAAGREGAAAGCERATADRYDGRDDFRGANAFLVGCRDAVSGGEALPWYGLRGHLGGVWGGGGSD